jgi:hypothetical protein
MTKDEIYEEIRTQLREAQESVVTSPWKFGDKDFVPHIRSALRHLRAVGVVTTGVMGTDGEFSADPGEIEGLLIVHLLVGRLLTGELTRKLLDGELGVVFRSGGDMLDTKTATTAFREVATQAKEQYDSLLTVALANADGGSNSIYGLQKPYVE